MRIALCFSGQNRAGHVTADNIKHYIGDLLSNCDVFAHFWDSENGGTNLANHLGKSAIADEWHIPKKINIEKNVEFFRQWAPRTIMTEEYNLQPTKNLWSGRRWDPVAQQYQVSMWRSIYEANKLKMDYAQKNQIVYDYTVRLRSDLVFGSNNNLAKDLKEIPDEQTMVFGDHYYTWDFDGRTRLEDIFWIGHSQLMDQVSSYCFAHANTIANIDEPGAPGYEDWQWHSCSWITRKLGYKIHALSNNMMRIFTEKDIEQGVDPLDPGFGRAPLYGAYNDKNIEKIRRW